MTLSTSQYKIYISWLNINSGNWIHVMRDATQHVNMTPLTVEDFAN